MKENLLQHDVPGSQTVTEDFVLLDKENFILQPKDALSALHATDRKLTERGENQEKQILIVQDNCKWCQRCGTKATPRWRYGPGGPLT